MKYIDTKLLDFVAEKFKDKVDKVGCPYIQHLIRVASAAANMCYFSEETSNKLYKIGLLHDIFEDTDTSVEELREYVDEEIIDAVRILTRDQEATYMDYINSIIESGNILVTIVKLCDLTDNMDITRYDNFADIPFDLLKRYYKAYKQIAENLKIL